jgi:hypothetical protein
MCRVTDSVGLLLGDFLQEFLVSFGRQACCLCGDSQIRTRRMGWR